MKLILNTSVLVITTILLLALFASSVKSEGSMSKTDTCRAISQLTMIVAQGRDRGVNPSQTSHVLIFNSIPNEVTKVIITYVYVKFPKDKPRDIFDKMFKTCIAAIGEPV